MASTPSRGDREIDLGTLGKVNCRPSLRALETLDQPEKGGPLFGHLGRFSNPHTQSLRQTVDVVYETHLDGENAETFSREEIGSAVLEVGYNSLADDCFELLMTAFAKADSDSEGDSGNE